MTTSQTAPKATIPMPMPNPAGPPQVIDLSNLKNLGKTRVEGAQPFGIITKGSGFIREYDGVINPYMGCSFGCSYCYASNFTNNNKDKQEWGQWVKVKTNALLQFARVKPGEMNDKTYYVSTVTDPYQPVENKVEITRGLLEMMVERQPRVRLVIQTRSPLVMRDLDLLAKIEKLGGRVQVNMTVTTDDDEIRKTYEPGCPSIQARLRAIQTVQDAGVQSCITMTPLLPIRNADQFIRDLKATGVKKFILQPFQMSNQDRGKFIAQTDLRAIASTASHFGCDEKTAIARYNEEFRKNRPVLKRAFPDMGYAREGFAPPF